MQKTILFFDDELMILKAIKRKLRNENHDLHFVSSTGDALEILRNYDVKVIFTDLTMPEVSGTEFLRIVKDQFPDIIGVIISGKQEEQPLNETSVYDYYIYKPIDYDKVKEIISNA